MVQSAVGAVQAVASCTRTKTPNSPNTAQLMDGSSVQVRIETFMHSKEHDNCIDSLLQDDLCVCSLSAAGFGRSPSLDLSLRCSLGLPPLRSSVHINAPEFPYQPHFGVVVRNLVTFLYKPKVNQELLAGVRSGASARPPAGDSC